MSQTVGYTFKPRPDIWILQMLAHACNLEISEEMFMRLKLFTGMRLHMTAPSSGSIKISNSEVVSGGSHWGSLLNSCKTNGMKQTA